MAIVKNNFRVSSRLKGGGGGGGGGGEVMSPSMSIDEEDDEQLRRQSSDFDDDEEEEEEEEGGEEEEEEDVDSGMDSDDVDLSELGEIGEELCQVGSQICSVPFELYDLSGLSEILSIDVWNECLTEEERFGLSKYLPDLEQESFLRTMKELFTGGNFHFGSPVVKLFDMMKGGLCEPRVMLYQHGWNFFQKFRHYHFLRKYQNSMVGKFVQINNAWLSCKGYGIEERLRVLNLTRSQKSLMHDKRDEVGLESDYSSGREDVGDDLYMRKKSKGHHPSLFRGSPTVDASPQEWAMVPETEKYGKLNRKRMLQITGSKASSGENLMGPYTSSQRGLDTKSRPYGLLPASVPGYDSRTLRQGKMIPTGGYGDPLVGVPLSTRHEGVHSQIKNWNPHQMDDMKVERGSPEYTPRDGARKGKFLDKHLQSSVEAQIYNEKFRTQPPMSKFIPGDRNQNYRRIAPKEEAFSVDRQFEPEGWDMRGDKWKMQQEFLPMSKFIPGDRNQKYRRTAPKEEAFSVDHQFESEGWNMRGDKWKMQPEFPSKKNNVGLDPKPRNYGYSNPQVNDVFSRPGYGTMKSGKKIKRESLQNGYDMEVLSQGDETESDSSEQGDEGEDANLLRNTSGYPSGVIGRHGKTNIFPRKDERPGSARSLPTYPSKSLKDDRGDRLHMQGVSVYPVKGKQKSKMLNSEEGMADVDPDNLHMQGVPVKGKQRSKMLNSEEGMVDVDPDTLHMQGVGVYPMKGKQKSKMLNSEEGMVDVDPDIKPGKKPFPLITPSIHTGFSFSIIHLLSAVRVAMVTPVGGDVSDIGRHIENADARQNGMHETDSGKPVAQSHDVMDASISDQAGSKNLPSLTVQEIVNRVKSNPGDPSILETQEPLQDLVRGVLKIFSSKTAPLGAKGWKALVSYEKSTKSWSWVGPVTLSTSDPDVIEEVTSCESWGLPYKMLVKLVDSFANWLKNGQETLQQIGSLPAPPLALMQPNLDEKERFRDLRAQKSLTTITPSSEEVRAYFRREEILRYLVPDRAFSYTAADGRKSIVAPLRRGGGKPTSKARDHPILKPDRPPHVTILCLVRDAAARLPGSIGTRADVCTLIRDSQYIVEDVTDAQVNQVVSGALDRLHYERDPCVQFDGERKLWVYLHRDREEEDFEDDGTSSTKKWKRPRKDATEQTDSPLVNVAYHGTGEQVSGGFVASYMLGDDLKAEPMSTHGMDMDDTLIHGLRSNDDGSTGPLVIPERSRLNQSRSMDWEVLGLNSLQGNNMACQENSTNEDYDDTINRDRSGGNSGPNKNNGVT